MTSIEADDSRMRLFVEQDLRQIQQAHVPVMRYFFVKMFVVSWLVLDMRSSTINRVRSRPSKTFSFNSGSPSRKMDVGISVKVKRRLEFDVTVPVVYHRGSVNHCSHFDNSRRLKQTQSPPPACYNGLNWRCNLHAISVANGCFACVRVLLLNVCKYWWTSFFDVLCGWLWFS